MRTWTSVERWNADQASLARRFWLTWRDGLRSDHALAMESVGCLNRGFARSIESMDRTQLVTFADALGSARIFEIEELRLEGLLCSEPALDETPVAPWMTMLGAFSAGYLTVVRAALLERTRFAVCHFGLRSPTCERAITETGVAELIARQALFARSAVLTLNVSLAMQMVADNVLGGASARQLETLKFAHAVAGAMERAA